MVMRETKDFKVILFTHGLYFVLEKASGEVFLKTTSINEYQLFLREVGK
jgi:hypothetical protein